MAGRAMSYSWGASRNPAGPTDGFPMGASADVVAMTPLAVPLEQRRLAAELAPMVDVWERLLAQHVPDRAGRCRACTKGGTGLPSTPWPCSIHGLAELARRHHGHRR
jgi:hypothetical protein